MNETSRMMTFDRFMTANTSWGIDSDDKRYLEEIVVKSIKLKKEGLLKLTYYGDIAPFVAMGGNVDDFIKYYQHNHDPDPRTRENWNEVLNELQDVFKEFFS
jgi:hypothetical protein